MSVLGGPFKKNKLKASGGTMSDEMALQITSMADIFMILMVFLLKSFSTSMVNITPTAGLKMPIAAGDSQDLNALKVEISEKAVSIESKPILTLNNFRLAKGDIEANGSSKALAAEFDTSRQRQVLIAKANSAVIIDAKVIVVADSRVPYSTIKSVLASAAIHGYTDFKLAVVKKE